MRKQKITGSRSLSEHANVVSTYRVGDVGGTDVVHDGGVSPAQAATRADDDRAVYCSCQKQTSYTFRGYVLRRDVTKFQGYTLLAV